MCWGVEVTAGMMVLGAAGAAFSLRRGDSLAVPVALGYFALMEGLQLAGYLVLDQCGTPSNELVTQLSMLHIAGQPIIINAFILALLPDGGSAVVRRWVLGLAALASAVILLQLLDIPQLGTCTPGFALCAETWCTRSGDWHLAWDVPYNGLMVPVETALGTGMAFPSYILAVFVMPLLYGAWRFTLFHALVGPILASQLTSDPNEAPAIWCLASVLILLVGLSPPVRRHFEIRRTVPG